MWGGGGGGCGGGWVGGGANLADRKLTLIFGTFQKKNENSYFGPL